ncbi:hypothetical protein [Flavobacterium sp. HNIBRBA15423]|uniref:hypothetical protein n=1 Tax=Flavobacterium sp. HNIBRBA15423 TaxID=3458683 RepID=UPI004044BB13
MKKVGGYVAFFGAFAIVLKFFDRVPRLLSWIYKWGDTVAWIIMIGITVAGLAIYFLIPKEKIEDAKEWKNENDTEGKI